MNMHLKTLMLYVGVGIVSALMFVVFILTTKAIVVEYEVTGQTRIYKQIFADDQVKYTAEYETQNGFGSSRWDSIRGNSLQCLQIKWSEDEPKRIIREYSEEKSLKCEQMKIDQWLAERKSEEVVASEYIKYP